MNRIAKDLGDHFINRLRQLMSDTAETMLDGDVDEREAATVLLSIMMQEAALGACCCGLSRDAFAALSVEAHRLAQPEAKRRARSYAKSH
jgi:hypothetical protein